LTSCFFISSHKIVNFENYLWGLHHVSLFYLCLSWRFVSSVFALQCVSFVVVINGCNWKCSESVGACMCMHCFCTIKNNLDASCMRPCMCMHVHVCVSMCLRACLCATVSNWTIFLISLFGTCCFHNMWIYVCRLKVNRMNFLCFFLSFLSIRFCMCMTQF
jgi:hypothetical protein